MPTKNSSFHQHTTKILVFEDFLKDALTYTQLLLGSCAQTRTLIPTLGGFYTDSAPYYVRTEYICTGNIGYSTLPAEYPLRSYLSYSVHTSYTMPYTPYSVLLTVSLLKLGHFMPQLCHLVILSNGDWVPFGACPCRITYNLIISRIGITVLAFAWQFPSRIIRNPYSVLQSTMGFVRGQQEGTARRSGCTWVSFPQPVAQSAHVSIARRCCYYGGLVLA